MPTGATVAQMLGGNHCESDQIPIVEDLTEAKSEYTTIILLNGHSVTVLVCVLLW